MDERITLLREVLRCLSEAERLFNDACCDCAAVCEIEANLSTLIDDTVTLIEEIETGDI